MILAHGKHLSFAKVYMGNWELFWRVGPIGWTKIYIYLIYLFQKHVCGVTLVEQIGNVEYVLLSLGTASQLGWWGHLNNNLACCSFRAGTLSRRGTHNWYNYELCWQIDGAGTLYWKRSIHRADPPCMWCTMHTACCLRVDGRVNLFGSYQSERKSALVEMTHDTIEQLDILKVGRIGGSKHMISNYHWALAG